MRSAPEYEPLSNASASPDAVPASASAELSKASFSRRFGALALIAGTAALGAVWLGPDEPHLSGDVDPQVVARKESHRAFSQLPVLSADAKYKLAEVLVVLETYCSGESSWDKRRALFVPLFDGLTWVNKQVAAEYARAGSQNDVHAGFNRLAAALVSLQTHLSPGQEWARHEDTAADNASAFVAYAAKKVFDNDAARRDAFGRRGRSRATLEGNHLKIQRCLAEIQQILPDH